MIDKNSIIYQLVTDRFENSDGNLEKVRDDQDYESKLTQPMGGTFKGIELRADYLSSLGITHLMMSPVERCKRSCYHGYSTTRPGLINLSFGGDLALKKLMAELKRRDIHTILDFACLATGKTPLIRNAKSSPPGSEERQRFFFREMFDHPIYGEETQKVSSKIDCGTGDYFYFYTPKMPILNLSNPIVFQEQVNRAARLVKRYGFSDIRIDMGYCLPEPVFKKLTDQLKHTLGSRVSILSENWPHPIHEFNGGEAFGLCDGEFNLKGTILFNNWGTEPQLIEKIREHFFRTKGKSDLGYAFVTGLDNHDLPRFKGDELSQKIAALFQFTLPNLTPLIYYGNECGMIDEGNDYHSRSRGVMRFSHTPLLDYYTSLVKFRRQHDFREAKLTNFQIYDTDGGSNYPNQLVTYNLHHSKNKRHHIVVNHSEHEKPVKLEDLVHDAGIIPMDIITKEELARTEDGRYMLSGKRGYLLSNRIN